MIDEFTRTLVRVVSIGDILEVFISGWEPGLTVFMPKYLIPAEFHEVGKRFHCQCNIGVEKPQLLVLKNFENE